MSRSKNADRRNRDLKSISALHSLLQKFSSDPESFALKDPIRSALSTQSKLAAYEDTARGIRAMSLNTQKIVATIALKNYEILDELRLAANAANQSKAKQNQPGPRTKIGLLKKLHEQEEQIRQLDADLGYMTGAVARLTACGRAFVDEVGTPEALVRWRKELRAVHAVMSLSSRPVSPKNVTDIRYGREKK